MTAIEVGAMLASTVLVKGSVIAAILIIAARFVRSAVLGLGPGALGLVVLLGFLIPDVNPGFVSISHEAIQGVSIGPLVVSPVGLFVALWAIGASLLLGRFLSDLLAARAIVSRAWGMGHGAWTAGPLQKAARAVSTTRIPQLRETTELSTAALIGFRKPVLLLPVQAREWSDEELFGVLCHELE